MIMTMVNIHEHVNLHMLNIQAPNEALDEENATKINVQNEGEPWTKHMNEQRGQNGGKERTTLDEAIGTQCLRN